MGERLPVAFLPLSGTVIEDEQLDDLDHRREMTIEVAGLHPARRRLLDTLHGTKAH